MVNVHIHQFAPGGSIVDEEAMKVFQAQWAIYQKLVDSDILSHAEVAAILNRTLVERFASPFLFLDIACGDASLSRKALAGARVSHYHGVDLAQPALDLAAANLEAAPYDIDLDHRDFVEAMADRPAHADAVWCGLSMHHLPTDEKRALFREIRAVTGDGGIFLVYEPTLGEGEDLPAYLARTNRIISGRWTMLAPDELEQIWHHIETCDLPESPAGWMDIGRRAGFSRATELFVDPTDLYRLFRFDA